MAEGAIITCPKCGVEYGEACYPLGCPRCRGYAEEAARDTVISAAEAWMLARMALIEAREQGGPEDIDRAELNLAHREMQLHDAVRALRALQQPAAPGKERT